MRRLIRGDPGTATIENKTTLTHTGGVHQRGSIRRRVGQSWFVNAMDRSAGLQAESNRAGLGRLPQRKCYQHRRSLWRRPKVVRASPQNDLSNRNVSSSSTRRKCLTCRVAGKSKILRTSPTAASWSHSASIFIAGWLITALATLFGARFWLDLLQGIIRLKGPI
jgi:hypothetical protein